MSDVRRMFVFTLVLAASAAVSTAEPLPEPYTLWIGAQGAQVYSGPGNDYYATQQLSPGSKCEVYEELRDGWLAIRPPEGSYSLVLRSALEMQQNDTARITRDRTPSRVGSVLADNYSSVHVRLDQDEIVQVIDFTSTSSSQWVAIAPPPGEFRWIRLKDTAPTPGVMPVVTKTGDSDWRGIVKMAGDAASDTQQGDDEELVRVVGHDEPRSKSDSEPGDAAEATTPDSRPAATDAFADQLNQLEVEVARRLAGPVNLWVFEDLEKRAAQLMSQASSQPAQQAVSSLAVRLDRFAAVGERYRQNQSSQTNSDSGIARIANDAADQNAALAGYDAVGVLRPVVSKHGNAPPYALVDDSGNIVTFVTPSPTLNLQQHLGQRVGVSGTRGFIPEYRGRNIQTAHIAPVDSALRR